MSAPRPLSRPIAVPSSRALRIARLGGMATSVAGRVLAGGAQTLARGERPVFRDLLMTPGNITRIADELARMRGAAMKLGQLISMDTGDMLPPELTEIMARLRADADHMPPRQLKGVLTAAWGENWLSRFERFDVRPIAAASIGQVHRAQTRDGRDLAIKIQYPGIRASIDSDVSNVGALIRMAGLIPAGIDMDPLLEDAKNQLRDEADYPAEAERLARFHALVGDDPDFVVPERHADLTTDTILAMTYVPSKPIEVAMDAPQDERDRVGTLLIDLTFRELFDWRFMQTDPNFANYRYDPESGRVVLLDFGAARAFGQDIADAYARLMRAGIDGARSDLEAAAAEIGFFDPANPSAYRAAVTDMIEMAFSGMKTGQYDFGDRAIVRRLNDAGAEMSRRFDVVHVPPIDALFLQRKFAGMYLLCNRLGARVPVRALLERHV